MFSDDSRAKPRSVARVNQVVKSSRTEQSFNNGRTGTLYYNIIIYGGLRALTRLADDNGRSVMYYAHRGDKKLFNIVLRVV